MNKKRTVLLLIFLLFLTISQASALDTDDNVIMGDNDLKSNDYVSTNTNFNDVAVADAYSSSINDNGKALTENPSSNEERISDGSNLIAADEGSNHDSNAILDGSYLSNVNVSDSNEFSESGDIPYSNLIMDNILSSNEIKLNSIGDLSNSVDENTLTSFNSDSNLRAGNVIYVSPDGTGSGSSISDPANWNNAYSIATSDDEIYFLDGVYKLQTSI